MVSGIVYDAGSINHHSSERKKARCLWLLQRVVLAEACLLADHCVAADIVTETPAQTDIRDLPDNQVVARVGTEEITAADVKAELRQFVERRKHESHNIAEQNSKPDAKPVFFDFKHGDKPAPEDDYRNSIYKGFGQKILAHQIEQKLVFIDAHQTVSEDDWKRITDRIYQQFEEVELPKLLLLNGVADEAALESKLFANGDSLIRIRKQYFQRMMVQGWMAEKISPNQIRSENETVKRQLIKQKIDEYLTELRHNTTVWTIYDQPVNDAFPDEPTQMFPSTFRDDVAGGKTQQLIPQFCRLILASCAVAVGDAA